VCCWRWGVVGEREGSVRGWMWCLVVLSSLVRYKKKVYLPLGLVLMMKPSLVRYKKKLYPTIGSAM
jgi:hypothetical protein